MELETNKTLVDQREKESTLEEPNINECIEIEVPVDLLDHLNSKDSSIQNLCRICLTKNVDCMFSLLELEDLALMFTSLTCIGIEQDESLPLFICEACKAGVIFCYEFKCRCTQSDFALRTVLKGVEKFEKIEERPATSDSCEDVGESTKLLPTQEIKIEEYNNTEYLEDLIESDLEESSLVKQEYSKNKKRLESNFQDTKSLQGICISKNIQKNKKSQKCVACTLCSRLFYSTKNLITHIEKKHGSIKSPFGCKHCNESFSSEHDLMLHSVLHNKGNKWKCNQCHKIFKTKPLLKRHILRHMEKKRYICAECDKPFTELYALRRHQKVHTGENLEKKYSCDICDKRFSASSLAAAHWRRHSAARPCVCAACGKAFPSPRLLASHQLTHSDRKPYACSYCDKRFRHESTRSTHHRTHTGEKPYVCAACGKAFIQNSNLTLHMRTHTGERPYSCKYCDSKFTSGSSLKSHERIHTGEKPFSCDVCKKKFARIDMKAHMRIHTGERPFFCSVCPKRFSTKSRLREHQRIHTGEKPFECSACPVKCSTKSHLVKHLKTHNANKIRDSIDGRKDKKNSGVTEQNVELQNELKSELHKGSDIQEGTICDMEVTGELTLPDHADIKDEVFVVDNSQVIESVSGGTWPNNAVAENKLNYVDNVKIIMVNDGDGHPESAGLVDGTAVKLYQLDQSLVQIHSSGGHLTISKITSKVTANF